MDAESDSLDEQLAQKIEVFDGNMDDIFAKALKFFSQMERKRTGTTVTWSSISSIEGLEIQGEVLLEYEKWYNGVRPLIADYLPDRLDELSEKYVLTRHYIEASLDDIKEFNSVNELRLETLTLMRFQRNLLLSIPSRIEGKEYKARKKVSDNIVSDELMRAESILNDGHIRAAGVVTGVTLERHLQTLCETSEQELEFEFMDGITSLAQTLNEANEIDDDDNRLLNYLAGIRNKCSHANKEDPEESEVKRLIDESEGFIKRT